MRYELSFMASGRVSTDRAVFERYFAARPNYTVSKGKARYENPDTSVSFLFQHGAGTDARGARPHAWTTFRLELPCPSYFAEEATFELAAFTREFGSDGAGRTDGEALTYSVPEFLRNWESANRLACAPFLDDLQPGEPPFTMPRARLLAAWQWNYKRRAMQDQEGGGLFVPRIWFIRCEDGAGTCVVWPDAIAVRAPQVEYIIFSRERLAPRHALGRTPDVALAPWSMIAPKITGNAFYDSQPVNWRVTDALVLNGITRVVSKLRGVSDMPDFLPPEAVLDEECFTAAP
jgi:hypothetical protein